MSSVELRVARSHESTNRIPQERGHSTCDSGIVFCIDWANQHSQSIVGMPERGGATPAIASSAHNDEGQSPGRPRNEFASTSAVEESTPESTAAATTRPQVTTTGIPSPSSSSSPRGQQRGIRYSFSSRGGVPSNPNHPSNTATQASGRRKKKKASEVSIRSVVQRVSHRAALSTKQAVWDSNDISMDAAVRAVDQWEAMYNFLRQCSILLLQQGQTLYQASKSGAQQMEQGILRPIRDWIVLPAFGGMEQGVMLLQSDRMHHFAEQSLQLLRCVPLIGDTILCPSLVVVGNVAQTSWHVVQYPIPSKQQVRDTVDWTLTLSKWALYRTCRELVWYIKRADASFRRSLSHTQWKVMGNGPYGTLDEATKQDVLSHMTDRYCSLCPHYNQLWYQNDTENKDTTKISNSPREAVDHDCIVARYELAAEIKRHNPTLYNDLIRSGLLLQRGGTMLKEDEWLKPCPVYRYLECHNFLIPEESLEDLSSSPSPPSSLDSTKVIMPLWFRLPSINGKPPPKDTPWVCFSESDQHTIEQWYRQIILQGPKHNANPSSQTNTTQTFADPHADTLGPIVENHTNGLDETFEASNLSPQVTPQVSEQEPTKSSKQHPTIAQWHIPDPSTDVLVDQKRHAVSIWLQTGSSEFQVKEDVETETTSESASTCHPDVKRPQRTPFLVPPPFRAAMRPTLWRFHGSGDAVVRSNWFLDTPRNGLQPFDDDAQNVLEDAYLFLKWMSIQKESWSSTKAVNRLETDQALDDENNDGVNRDSIGGQLLTIEVTCPDGEERLVQFGSLTHATAIQKGFGAAVSINKLRVYRGAWLAKPRTNDADDSDVQTKSVETFLQESIVQAAAEHGTLGETHVPNTCLRSILKPPPEIEFNSRISMLERDRMETSEEEDLAVPTFRLMEEDMAGLLKDSRGGSVDHLCLIVHGIGEMMQAIDLFGLALPNLSTIVDCCDFLRKNHQEVQSTDLSQTSLATSIKRPTQQEVPGRVEYLPVEWHEAFSILSQRRTPSVSVPDADRTEDHFMLKDISLPTIPKMREFANDTLMDVLYFMSPEHHDIIIDIVTTEMNIVVDKFRQLTGFSGRISVIGHSLGSIISWDILANQRTSPEMPLGSEQEERAESAEGNQSNGSLQSLLSDYGTARSIPADGPETDHPPLSVAINNPLFSYPQLQFQVENFFLMGSPVAVFLMIRNQRRPLHESFYLNGCRRVFNIFHPYDVRSW